MKLAALAAIVGAAAGLATALPAARAQATPGERGFVHVDLPAMVAGPATPPSRVLYLNDCRPSGCVIRPGNFETPDDSRTNVSAIIEGSAPRTLAPYTGSAAAWNAIVACVRENYAPFDIEIVTTEPPPSTSYFEAFAAGRPEDVGYASNLDGIASFNCGVIPNAISFSFLNRYPSDVLVACWTISQESAHNLGLSHTMLPADVMTYNPSPARKRFIDQTACVGVQGCCVPESECVCNLPNDEQNSYQTLLSIFGPAGSAPPAIAIDEPRNHDAVEPGFAVRATVTDVDGVTEVELVVDGVEVGVLTAPPFAFTAPADLVDGAHTVMIRARDTTGDQSTAAIRVTVGEPCRDNAACAAIEDGYVCVDGRCVPGGDVSGGLGEPCESPADCLSGLCVSRGGDHRCSESCNASDPASCGSGYTCFGDQAGGGACWPADESCAGCATGGGAAPTAPIGAGLLLSALLLRRRRVR